MCEVLTKLFTYFNLKNAGLKRSTLKDQNIVIWTIMEFLPALDPCGICYTNLNSRQKCQKCVFILCGECSPRIHNQCPHCQRIDVYPGMTFKTVRQTPRLTNAFLTWVDAPSENFDNPFGPVFDAEGVPLLQLPRLNVVPRTCRICHSSLRLGETCFCLNVGEMNSTALSRLVTPMSVPETRTLINVTQRNNPVWRSRSLNLGGLFRDVISTTGPRRRYQIPRYECFCDFRTNEVHVCPFGPLCRHINARSSETEEGRQ